MDFKTLVHKESFKAVLLHHLKNQVRKKYGHAISNKIQDSLEKDSISSSHIVSSVSEDILESQEFPEFLSSFLGSVNTLLEDKDKYIPKQDKPRNSSQCSSASSVNASSIDFLSPDQFQNITQSLETGTNAEKLEALGILCRLPTLEHLTHHFLWADVENGIHNALTSPIIFLKDQSLRLYIKMLTCPEPKVVQESYQSLIKYFLQVLLPSLNSIEKDSYIIRCRCAVEIISILNRFLQSISTHWLRYPQSMIENITTQSLSILSSSCKDDMFPVWMCTALCDPEAKWLKSILHGHISRASLLNALGYNLDILYLAVSKCNKFSSGESHLVLKGNCCQKSHLVTEITHTICFLSHLLRYGDGRLIFNSMLDEKILGSWTNVLDIVMNCVCMMCNTVCFNCCSVTCSVVSRKWFYIWCNEDTSVTNDNLIHILGSYLNKEYMNMNMLYFSMRCLNETYRGVNNVSLSSESQSNIDRLLLKLLTYCFEISDDITEIPSSVIHVFNSSLILMKAVFLTPSTLFLNEDFIKTLSQWLLKIQTYSSKKHMSGNSNLSEKPEMKIVSEMEHNILDILICFLHKPIDINFCQDISIYEERLNILLEKILKDIKCRHSVCPLDISILCRSLNRSVCSKSILNKTTIFRLSSIIWQLKEGDNDIDSLQTLKFVLEAILPSICCDLILPETIDRDNLNPEVYLFEYVLLFPNITSEYFDHEDYSILALQIISLLCTSIQSLCVLQSEFNIAELLLKRQSQNLIIDYKQVIDPISVLQNHILVKLDILGGPNERNLPSEVLQSNSDCYNWPFVTEFPVPEIFFNVINHSDRNDINDELKMDDLRVHFLSSMQSNSTLSPSSVYQLLKNSLSTLQSMLNLPKTTDAITLDAADSTLHNTELVGLRMVKRYGEMLNLISNIDDKELEQLLNASKCLLGSEDSNRLDIFVCTIYLMCRGDIATAWLFLQNFTNCSASLFVWRRFVICSNKSSTSSYITLESMMFELCDLIVKKTLPQLFSALQFHGILPSVIFNYWTVQCYWNYLDFVEISHFVLLNIVFSGEYTLYFFVAILKHLQSFILEHAHNSELFSMLLKNPIHGFTLCKYMDFMIELSDTFHDIISKPLLEIMKDQTI